MYSPVDICSCEIPCGYIDTPAGKTCIGCQRVSRSPIENITMPMTASAQVQELRRMFANQ